LEKTDRLQAEIMNLNGQRLQRLENFQVTAGQQRLCFDPGALPAGTYFPRVLTGEQGAMMEKIVKYEP
jgi:hypothetical protein